MTITIDANPTRRKGVLFKPRKAAVQHGNLRKRSYMAIDLPLETRNARPTSKRFGVTRFKAVNARAVSRETVEDDHT
ncbi:hypothetical protein [Salipiger bermudensis]|uniref:hypothetical protein n=1 Tax=Salipiger bermudensis TaxID=344736 RepID=UPI001A8E4B85|nr:hypothetical protein [Salipiger bermudensis]MBN9674712.1 hypothetical protein [Salipiger bermudensis]